MKRSDSLLKKSSTESLIAILDDIKRRNVQIGDINALNSLLMSEDSVMLDQFFALSGEDALFRYLYHPTRVEMLVYWRMMVSEWL